MTKIKLKKPYLHRNIIIPYKLQPNRVKSSSVFPHLPNARKPKKSSYLFIHFFGQKASYLSCSFIGTLHTSPQGHTTYIVST